MLTVFLWKGDRKKERESNFVLREKKEEIDGERLVWERPREATVDLVTVTVNY